jgi:hypothetical protein
MEKRKESHGTRDGKWKGRCVGALLFRVFTMSRMFLVTRNSNVIVL